MQGDCEDLSQPVCAGILTRGNALRLGKVTGALSAGGNVTFSTWEAGTAPEFLSTGVGLWDPGVLWGAEATGSEGRWTRGGETTKGLEMASDARSLVTSPQGSRWARTRRAPGCCLLPRPAGATGLRLLPGGVGVGPALRSKAVPVEGV